MRARSRIRRLEKEVIKSDDGAFHVALLEDGIYKIRDRELSETEFNSWSETLPENDVIYIITIREEKTNV